MIIIEKITDAKLWDQIVSKSGQYSLFCSSSFLLGLICPYEWYFVKEKENIKMAVLIFKKKNEAKYFFQDFNYNQGFYFFDNHLIERKKIHERIKLIDLFLKFISKTNDELRFSLHYSLKDVRAFQWFQYPKKKIQINCVYTSIVDLTKFNDFNDFLKSIRYERRREFKIYNNSHYKVVQKNDLEKFIKFYELLESDVGSFAYKTHIKLIRNAYNNSFCRINFLFDGDKIIAATLFYVFKDKLFYAFSVSDPNYKKKISCSVPLILEQIDYGIKNKIKTLDFMGANSPNRSDYKESYGGNLEFFFELIYNK